MLKRGIPGRGLWLPLQASTRMVCLPVRSSQEWIEVISRPLSARMVARCSLSRASSTMIPRRLPSADLARTYTTSSSDTLVNTPSCNRKAAMWLRISHWYSRNDAALAGTSHMFNAKCAAIVTAAAASAGRAKASGDSPAARITVSSRSLASRW